MIRRIMRMKEEMITNPEVEIREDLSQIMEKLNEAMLDVILAYDMIQDLQLKMDGDE